MKSVKEVEDLEKLIGQLNRMHSEMSQLARKSPNDGLNTFKLNLVNKLIQNGNRLLGGRYRPFDDFNQFEEGNLPTNSDITMILAQYIEQAERFRSDNVIYDAYEWQYIVNGKPSGVKAREPTEVGGGAK